MTAQLGQMDFNFTVHVVNQCKIPTSQQVEQSVNQILKSFKQRESSVKSWLLRNHN